MHQNHHLELIKISIHPVLSKSRHTSQQDRTRSPENEIIPISSTEDEKIMPRKTSFESDNLQLKFEDEELNFEHDFENSSPNLDTVDNNLVIDEPETNSSIMVDDPTLPPLNPDKSIYNPDLLPSLTHKNDNQPKLASLLNQLMASKKQKASKSYSRSPPSVFVNPLLNTSLLGLSSKTPEDKPKPGPAVLKYYPGGPYDPTRNPLPTTKQMGSQPCGTCRSCDLIETTSTIKSTVTGQVKTINKPLNCRDFGIYVLECLQPNCGAQDVLYTTVSFSSTITKFRCAMNIYFTGQGQQSGARSLIRHYKEHHPELDSHGLPTGDITNYFKLTLIDTTENKNSVADCYKNWVNWIKPSIKYVVGSHIRNEARHMFSSDYDNLPKPIGSSPCGSCNTCRCVHFTNEITSTSRQETKPITQVLTCKNNGIYAIQCLQPNCKAQGLTYTTLSFHNALMQIRSRFMHRMQDNSNCIGAKNLINHYLIHHPEIVASLNSTELSDYFEVIFLESPSEKNEIPYLYAKWIQWLRPVLKEAERTTMQKQSVQSIPKVIGSQPCGTCRSCEMVVKTETITSTATKSEAAIQQPLNCQDYGIFAFECIYDNCRQQAVSYTTQGFHKSFTKTATLLRNHKLGERPGLGARNLIYHYLSCHQDHFDRGLPLELSKCFKVYLLGTADRDKKDDISAIYQQWTKFIRPSLSESRVDYSSLFPTAGNKKSPNKIIDNFNPHLDLENLLKSCRSNSNVSLSSNPSLLSPKHGAQMALNPTAELLNNAMALDNQDTFDDTGSPDDHLNNLLFSAKNETFATKTEAPNFDNPTLNPTAGFFNSSLLPSAGNDLDFKSKPCGKCKSCEFIDSTNEITSATTQETRQLENSLNCLNSGVFAVICLQCNSQAIGCTTVCFRNTLSNLRAAIQSTNDNNPTGSRIHHKYLINHYEEHHPEILESKPDVANWYRIILLDSGNNKTEINEKTEQWIGWAKPSITSKITNKISERHSDKEARAELSKLDRINSLDHMNNLLDQSNSPKFNSLKEYSLLFKGEF